MKKAQLGWTALVFLFVLAACGGTGTEPTAGGSGSTVAESSVAVTEDEFGRQISGIDPDSGLEINPVNFAPGSTAIVVGKITSMNLTPTTAPEFVVQTESGKRFRFRAQDLANVHYEDGSEIRLHEFQIGMYSRATITLDARASLSDVALSDDLTILKNE